MRIVNNEVLRKQYLTSSPFTDYFRGNVADYVQIIEYEAGEEIMQQTTEPTYLHLMVQGRCSVRVLLANGKSVILQTLHGPCLIGEMELVRKVASFTVQALEICRMLSIPLRYCRNYLLQDAYFLRKLCFDLIGKERTEALSLITAFGYPLENRMAKFILDNRQGDYFYIKKVHVAESLGVSYRHAGKIMHDFIEKGYLSKEKMVYTITDENALMYLAKELKAADIVGDL